MRADDEGVADGPSAAAVLAVAEGLRRRDPQLSAALAEHAARLCDDGGGRGEAELSSVLARRELDRPDEVAVRGVPALREAERDGRGRDAAVLRCTLADAALTWSDVDVARALLAPLASGDGLPEHVRLALAVARADLVAARGDVAAVDAVATEAEAFSATREERLLAHTDLVRARGRARRTAGDLAGARDLLERACREPVPDAVDGGRRRVLATGELVDVLVALGERAAAGEAAEPVLAGADDVMTALPLALLRCRTASGVHLPAGELDRAEVLARAAADGLAGRGHDRALAGAEEVLAAVAEGRGDLQSALAARTRAHHLDRQSLRAEAAYRVELALAVGYAPSTTVTASPAPELVGRRRARHDTVAARTNGTLSGASNGAGHGASNGTGHGASNGAGYEVGNGASNGSRNGATNGSRVGRHGGHAAEPGPPRPEEATPHGLSRILDEITADAGSDVGDELVPGAGAGPGRNGAVPSRQQPDEHRNGAAAPPRRVPRRGDPAPDPTAGPDDAEEYEGELRLTREDLLAEYGTTAPGRPHPRAGANGRPARPVGPPPTAWSFHGERGGPPHPDDHGTASDPLAEESAEPDGGARLADLLAEAMDAFRRAAPEQGSIDPTPSERRPPRWRAPR